MTSDVLYSRMCTSTWRNSQKKTIIISMPCEPNMTCCNNLNLTDCVPPLLDANQNCLCPDMRGLYQRQSSPPVASLGKQPETIISMPCDTSNLMCCNTTFTNCFKPSLHANGSCLCLGGRGLYQRPSNIRVEWLGKQPEG